MNTDNKVLPTIESMLRGFCIAARAALRAKGEEIVRIKKAALNSSLPTNVDRSEVVANLTLSYCHVEDAIMRLGKAIQALDGGVSCYYDDTKSLNRAEAALAKEYHEAGKVLASPLLSHGDPSALKTEFGCCGGKQADAHGTDYPFHSVPAKQQMEPEHPCHSKSYGP
jgi:hypothetical protein